MHRFDGLSASFDGGASPHQAHILDELEFLTQQMRYHTARQLIEDKPSHEFAAVCQRCDRFPLDSDEACPECGSDRFLSMLRI